MIGLIKMELYRLIHTVSIYVSIAVIVGIVVMTTFAVNVDLRMMEKEQKTQGAEQIQQKVTENESREDETPAESFASGFSDGFISTGEGDLFRIDKQWNKDGDKHDKQTTV